MFVRSLLVAVALLVCACTAAEPQKQFQFGVGTFQVRRPNAPAAWVSVNQARDKEVWVFDHDWPGGLQSTVTLTFTRVNAASYASTAALKVWVKDHPNESGHDGGNFAPGGLDFAASDVALQAAAQSPAVDGIGTFRVKRNSAVVAWLSIESDRTERWILAQTWTDIAANTTLLFEEVKIDKAFTSHEALRHWIESNNSGVALNQIARLHEISSKAR